MGRKPVPGCHTILRPTALLPIDMTNVVAFSLKDSVVLITAFLCLMYGVFFLKEKGENIIANRLLGTFMLTVSVALTNAVFFLNIPAWGLSQIRLD